MRTLAKKIPTGHPERNPTKKKVFPIYCHTIYQGRKISSKDDDCNLIEDVIELEYSHF